MPEHHSSTFSDAQDLIGFGQGERASDRINHAKRHLMAGLDAARAADEPGRRDVIFSITSCALGEGGH